jgi:hypothetical protein
MNEKEQFELVKKIEINMSVIEQVMEHFKKTNWLHMKDFVEMIDKAKKLQKNGTDIEKPKSN